MRLLIKRWAPRSSYPCEPVLWRSITHQQHHRTSLAVKVISCAILLVSRLFAQRLTFPFPFVHHQSHDWKVEQLLTLEPASVLARALARACVPAVVCWCTIRHGFTHNIHVFTHLTTVPTHVLQSCLRELVFNRLKLAVRLKPLSSSHSFGIPFVTACKLGTEMLIQKDFLFFFDVLFS